MRRFWPGFAPLLVLLAAVPQARADEPSQVPSVRPLEDRPAAPLLAELPTTLTPDFVPIDLPTALRLAGLENPDLWVARQRVVEAEALRTLAAVQLLPTLNAGLNYSNHTGNLQQSNGNILSLNRYSLYLGSGTNAVGSGTVTIPGVVLQGNLADVTFRFLAARQVVNQRRAGLAAQQNQALLEVCVDFTELLRAEGRLAIARQARAEAREVARLTAEYAATGEGRQADADRAATELARREADTASAEGALVGSSARLCAVLNLDPSIRLHPSDSAIAPQPIVPSPIPIQELIALAILRRPELAERQAAIREALYSLEGARLLPFSPTVLIGYSGGVFGGGSNLVRPIFGGVSGRTDLDAVTYWSLQNLGIGNRAMIRAADAKAQQARAREVVVLNRVRAEVAEARARSFARLAQVGVTEQAIQSGRRAFGLDFARIQLRAGREVLPIELLNSFRLLNQARYDYLDAIADFNRAQFELFVAIGLPPADALARPAPLTGLPPAPGSMAIPAPDAGTGPSLEKVPPELPPNAQP